MKRMSGKAFGLAFAVAAVAGAAGAVTIDVPAGRTETVPAGTVYTGEKLVKTGAGTLDLSSALLQNAGLEVREGAVRLTATAKPGPVSGQYVRFTATASRPNAEYSGRGWQIAEFQIARNGKPLANPPATRGMTMGGTPGGREGPAMGVDGKLETKCYIGYRQYMVVDYGAPQVFDGYTFVTANDAIGRDPMDFTLDVGEEGPHGISWASVSSVKGFLCPEKRHTPVGNIFPVVRFDKIPAGYPVLLCGKGRLVLVNLTEALENISGGGLVEAVGGSLEISPDAPFDGSVVGSGTIIWRNPRKALQ